MIRKILRTTNPKLREKSKPVTKADKKLIELICDMEETLKAQKDPEGLGLAAPQIGELKRVFLVLRPKTQKAEVFINPEIMETEVQRDGETEEPKFMEGCLSLPHYYGPVQRAESVTLKYLKIKNLKLKISRRKFSGFLAHIIQHEVDHLNGILFVDRLLQQNRKFYQLRGKEWAEIKLV